MKKSKKVGLIIVTCSVLLFGVTVFLQYKVFHKEESEELYKKVTMKNLSSGKIEQVSKENMIEEVVENPLVPEGQQTPTVEEQQQQPQVEQQQQPAEEVVPEEEIKEITTYEDITTTPVEPVVYDGLTLNQLAEKLNRSLKSNIAGKGYLIASHCLELGVDPYLAVAIMLHETGCSQGSCSSLVQKCNNVGGQKGGPSCGGGSYKAYPTLDEGIIGYIDNLYNNYVSKGLTTADLMGPRYAASPTWTSKVNSYIALVKNN